MELDEIYEKYKTDPRLDSMRKPGIKFVPGKGPLNPDIMLIGEAPGSLENAKQEPFQGKAGKYLKELLEYMELNRADIFITNAVKYWPLTNEIPPETRQPDNNEIGYSRFYLAREIEIVKPKIIGLCGYSAIRALFPAVQDVNSNHGALLADKYVPLYHPAIIGYKSHMRGKVKKGYKMLTEYLIQKGV